MNTAIEAFLQFWSEAPTESAPFVHPTDAPFIRDGDLELSLLPIPMNGSLIEAEAVVLMLNPGLDKEDRAWEQRPDFRGSLVKNLRQQHSGEAYPLNYLNPAFAMHPGAGYWSQTRKLGGGVRDAQKLNAVVEALASRDNVAPEAARAHVARKVAILQLCPYHSSSKPPTRLLRGLPSCVQARSLLNALLSSGDKLVIATRSVAEWGFTRQVDTDRLVVYAGNQGTSASLTLQSSGGQALVKRLSPVQRRNDG